MDSIIFCKQCNKELNINRKSNFCSVNCYRKYRYNQKKPIRLCVYCKHIIKSTAYKYCSEQHRKFFERLIRARLKVRRLVECMNRARNGYRKEYKKIWSLRNHDKILTYNHKSYYKNRERKLLARKLYYQKNRDVIIKKNQERRQKQNMREKTIISIH